MIASIILAATYMTTSDKPHNPKPEPIKPYELNQPLFTQRIRSPFTETKDGETLILETPPSQIPEPQLYVPGFPYTQRA